MKKVYVVVIIFLFSVYLSNNLSAQNDDEVWASDWLDQGIVVGTNFSKYLYGEINYYKSSIYESGGFPVFSKTMSYGVEYSYFDKFVLAPKIQRRIHYMFVNVGLTALCYTDLKSEYAVKLRPEIGFGLWNIDINYGYNIGIYKNGFNQLNHHLVTLRYYFRIHRKTINQYNIDGKIID